MNDGDQLLIEGRAHLHQGRLREADELFERALLAAPVLERPAVASRAGLFAQKENQPRAAIRWYRRAGELSPRDPEPRHDRGIAHLEAGEVGLAALAQAEALALDSEHTGARAQRAAALEALGDDDGAQRELSQLLLRLGPQPALSARLIVLQQAAARALSTRLLGAQPARLIQSPLIGHAFAQQLSQPLSYRAPFGELHLQADAGVIERLDLVFEKMEASLARSDLSYGGTTEDDHGRRVPLDEFTSAGTVFFAQALGIDALRARRLLAFLLTPECGLDPHPIAAAQVGWTIALADGQRRYGLFAQVGEMH